MNHIHTLSKLLHIHEREKNEAQVKHSQSVDAFESLAESLYELLVKKERLEEELSLSNKKRISIGEIQSKQSYLENLTNQIIVLQKDVSLARETMEKDREALTEAHIEMKKIEKMIEFRQEKIKEKIKREESNFMDEISIQQYMANNR
ncbi:MAG TPA: flagellar export protein FliJ [Bacillota bacterium]|nr:flagellar export protein FliJ [Bacillota bacterium]